MVKADKKTRKTVYLTVAALVIAATVVAFVLIGHRETDAEVAARYVVNNTTAEFGCEWAAAALARGNYKYAVTWMKKYRTALENEITSSNGVLSETTTAVNSRAAIACATMRVDARDVCGCDLTKSLVNTENVMSRGLNCGIYALIALDLCDGDIRLREEYVDIILENQQRNGAFGIKTGVPDVDVTAMALQALSMHMEREDVKNAVKRAVKALSDVQKPCGGFAAMGEINSQSLAQVILACDSLDISLDDPLFVKDGKSLYDTLMTYKRGDGGFARTVSDETSSLSATLQVLQALTATELDEPFYEIGLVHK